MTVITICRLRSRAVRSWSLMACLTGALIAMAPLRAQGPAVVGYVTGAFENNVSAIDAATNTVIATIPVGEFPTALAVTPDGTRAYVVNTASFPFSLAGTVSVIETATNTVVATIAVGPDPSGVAITPDGARAYVTDTSASTLSVINTSTNSVVATIPVGIRPTGIAITPDGSRAYVANSGDDTVSVIDTATNAVVATVAIGAQPVRIAILPSGANAYVVNSADNTVSVINIATNTVAATIPVGMSPFAVAVTPDGTRAYVTNSSDSTLSVINTSTNTVAATLPMAGFPLGVVVTPDGSRAYVGLSENGTAVTGAVLVIDTATNGAVGSPIPVGLGTYQIAFAQRIVPFGTFKANLAASISHGVFVLGSTFTLGSASKGINPGVNSVTEPVTLRVGTFTITVPPCGFKRGLFGWFVFSGTIGGVQFNALIIPLGSKNYAFTADAFKANLSGTTSPVPVSLTIGNDGGSTSVPVNLGH